MDRMASAPGPYTVLRGHASDVQALTFLNDTLFFSGDAEGRVHLWDMEERRSVHTQALHGLLTGILYLQVVHIPKSGRLLISYGRDGMIKGWQIHGSGAPSSAPQFCISTGSYNFCRPHAAGAPATAAAQCHQGAAGPCHDTKRAACDSCCLVAGAVAEDGAVCVWDVCRDGIEVLKLSRPPLPGPNSGTNALGNSSRGMCMAVQLIPGASTSDWHLLSGYEDGSVAVWDLSSPQQPRADVRGVHSEPLLCLAANAHHCRSQYDGKQGQQVAAVSGGTDAHVACYALRCGAGSAGVGSNAGLGIAAQLQLPSPGISDCDIRGDGCLFALACWDGKVRVHSTKAKRRCAPLALLRHHTKEVTCVRFAPMAPPRQASQVPPCIDEHAKCVCMDCERKNAERVLERRPGSGAEKVASVLGKVELVHGRVQEEGQGFVGQESVQAPGCSDARVEDASGDQGACSDKYGMRMLELTSAPAATVGRRGKDAGGDQGACSKEHGEEGEPGKGNLDDEVASGYGHGSWGEGPISARHGTLLSASRDGSIAVWHVFPP